LSGPPIPAPAATGGPDKPFHDGRETVSACRVYCCVSPKRRLLLPHGMHRSGTSLLTYLLHTPGATLPDDVVGPAYGNPLVRWELRDFVAINDDALRAIDRSWDDPRPIDTAWFRSRDAYRFIERRIVQIGHDYGCAPFIPLKDPRICRILPSYAGV
jgi:hypothetical protein